MHCSFIALLPLEMRLQNVADLSSATVSSLMSQGQEREWLSICSVPVTGHGTYIMPLNPYKNPCGWNPFPSSHSRGLVPQHAAFPWFGSSACSTCNYISFQGQRGPQRWLTSNLHSCWSLSSAYPADRWLENQMDGVLEMQNRTAGRPSSGRHSGSNDFRRLESDLKVFLPASFLERIT